ncbi:ABC transporter ATP-binding protein [Xanthobacteraceae bacterium Astr-EGSB]|uniref:ABC transporter ATP-binding protein n=1 Tax=Astrobacterium formosum TaxID=3069710 RepID=UPI0027AE49CB|nr:ABC transporter ATP-binding protein [Xanthobacteraceae bacterium Astr-EGSB]
MSIELDDAGICRNGRWLWRHLSLRLEPATVTVVIGPNGSGKTTLVRTLAGLIDLAEGRRRNAGAFGYVPQTTQIGLPFRVAEVVAMGRLRDKPLFARHGVADRVAVEHAIAAVGIGHLAERPFTQISGGERQLVLLARALATGGSTLLLDEPFAALDLRRQGRMLDLLADLAGTQGMSVLFTTHDPDHGLRIGDRAVALDGAGAAIVGTVDDVLDADVLAAVYGVPMRRIAIERNDQETSHHVIALI